MEQVPQECLILTDRCQLGDYARIEFMGVLWSKVAQPLPFQPTPQRLDGIEHRRVRGQLLQGQPIGEVIHQRADRVALSPDYSRHLSEVSELIATPSVRLMLN